MTGERLVKEIPLVHPQHQRRQQQQHQQQRGARFVSLLVLWNERFNRPILWPRWECPAYRRIVSFVTRARRPLFALTRPISAVGNTNNAGERGLVTYDAVRSIACPLCPHSHHYHVLTQWRPNIGFDQARLVHTFCTWSHSGQIALLPPTNSCEMRRPRRGHGTWRQKRRSLWQCTVRSERTGIFQKEEMDEGFMISPTWR